MTDHREDQSKTVQKIGRNISTAKYSEMVSITSQSPYLTDQNETEYIKHDHIQRYLQGHHYVHPVM